MKGVAALAEALAQNDALQALVLDTNSAGDEGAEVLAKHLSRAAHTPALLLLRSGSPALPGSPCCCCCCCVPDFCPCLGAPAAAAAAAAMHRLTFLGWPPSWRLVMNEAGRSTSSGSLLPCLIWQGRTCASIVVLCFSGQRSLPERVIAPRDFCATWAEASR